MYSIGYKPLRVSFCKRCPVNNLHILVLLCHGSDLVIRLFLPLQMLPEGCDPINLPILSNRTDQLFAGSIRKGSVRSQRKHDRIS